MRRVIALVVLLCGVAAVGADPTTTVPNLTRITHIGPGRIITTSWDRDGLAMDGIGRPALAAVASLARELRLLRQFGHKLRF